MSTYTYVLIMSKMGFLMDYFNRVSNTFTRLTMSLLPSDLQNVERSKQCAVLHVRHHRVCPTETELGKV